MTILSSHILDSISGRSAAGIRVQCFRLLRDDREMVFDIVSDEEGRFSQSVNAAGEEGFELVFYGQDYFSAQYAGIEASSNVRSVVVRFMMVAREAKYHIPLVLSPHSYTVWHSA